MYTRSKTNVPRLNHPCGHVAHLALLAQLVLILEHQAHADADEARRGREHAQPDVGEDADDELGLPLPRHDVSVPIRRRWVPFICLKERERRLPDGEDGDHGEPEGFAEVIEGTI